MKNSVINRKRIRRWFGWSALAIALLFCILVLPTLVKKARLIRHVEEVGGFFYSYHSPTVKKLLKKNHYEIKGFIVPKLEPLLGRHWPGIFKNITHVEIDLRNGGSDWDLSVLRNQNQIIWLDIGRLPIEKSEIEIIKTLPSLKSLRINIEQLDAEGIAVISGLKNFQYLALKGRELTEEEAVMISKMEIKWLGLEKIYMDPEQSKATARIKEELPLCLIVNEGDFWP